MSHHYSLTLILYFSPLTVTVVYFLLPSPCTRPSCKRLPFASSYRICPNTALLTPYMHVECTMFKCVLMHFANITLWQLAFFFKVPLIAFLCVWPCYDTLKYCFWSNICNECHSCYDFPSLQTFKTLIFCPLRSATSTSSFPFSSEFSFPITALTSPKCAGQFFIFIFSHSVLCVPHQSPWCRCAPPVWFSKRRKKTKNTGDIFRRDSEQTLHFFVTSSHTVMLRQILITAYGAEIHGTSVHKVSLRAYMCVRVCCIHGRRNKNNNNDWSEQCLLMWGGSHTVWFMQLCVKHLVADARGWSLLLQALTEWTNWTSHSYGFALF